MATQNPTVDHLGEVQDAVADTTTSGEMLSELTRCLTYAYTARARLRLDRGELDPAVADLNEAVRLAPHNAEARRLLDLTGAERSHGVQGPSSEGRAPWTGGRRRK